jgi:hypothetical protein
MLGIRLRLVGLGIAATCLAPPLRGATLRTVTSTSDSGPGTLRAAILASADGDSIAFDASIASQTITLSSGEIDINASISMTGGVKISGNSASRIFKIAAGKTVSLQALTFLDGLDKGADGGAGLPGSPGFGGAIWNQGTLHLLSCGFESNHAQGGGGGLGSAGGDAAGGAIYNAAGASLDVSTCEFDDNGATAGTGGAGSAGGGFPGGSGGMASGGAIWSEGNLLSITGSTFQSNTVAGGNGGNGGIFEATGGAGDGGAVWSADQQFSVAGSSFLKNSAAGGIGIGPGLGGNGEGGALLVESDTAPTIDRSTFDRNSAAAGSGEDISHFGSSRGGAISQVGVLTIRTSTISNNTASIHSEGGGIFASGSIAVTNCTITGNAVQEGLGGGFSSTQASTLTNVTIAGNASDVGGGGIHITGSGPTLIINSIVAQNTSSSTDPDGRIENADVVSGGHNVIGVAFGGVSGGSFTPAAGDQIGTVATPLDPGLDPLASNGGPTLTMALELTSPALDHGDDAICPPTDQTTVTTRPQGAHCDVGAYELPAAAGGTGSNAFTLTVIVVGAGSVTSAPSAGIDCPTACSAAYFPGTGITLTETPSAGSTFAGWTGACSGVISTASVTVNSDITCTASFTSPATIPTAGGGALAGLALLLGIAGWTVLRRM